MENDIYFHLVDAFGRNITRMVLPAGMQEQKLDLTNLTPGLYMIVLEENGRILGKEKIAIL